MLSRVDLRYIGKCRTSSPVHKLPANYSLYRDVSDVRRVGQRAQRTHEYYYCIFNSVVSNLLALPYMEQTTMKQRRVATKMTLRTRKVERGSSNTSPAIKRVPARCVHFLFSRPSVKTLHFLHSYFFVYQRRLGDNVFIGYGSDIPHYLPKSVLDLYTFCLCFGAYLLLVNLYSIV